MSYSSTWYLAIYNCILSFTPLQLYYTPSVVRMKTLYFRWYQHGGSQVVLVVKNLPVNAGDVKDVGSITGSGRSPGGGYGNPLPYPCVENLMDRGGSQHSTSYTKDIQIFEKWINRYQHYMYFALPLEYSIQILVVVFFSWISFFTNSIQWLFWGNFKTCYYTS